MALLRNERIRHSVVFRLVHPAGSQPEREFLVAIARLGTIDGVENFELTREIGAKNGYRFALTMEFADSAAYQAYNDHPDHVSFVRSRWDSEIADFLETDTAAL